MKRMKLFTCMLLCAGMVLSFTACTTKDAENKDVVNSTVESDTIEDSATVESSTTESDNEDRTVESGTEDTDTAESDTADNDTAESDTVENDPANAETTDNDTVVQESLPEVTDDAESSESTDADTNATTPRPDNIFPGMGVDNGYFFATPIANGEPVHAKMDEVRLFSAESNISTGAIVNLAGMDEEYIVIELDTYGISFINSNPDENDSDRTYCLTPGHLLYFEEESEPLQFLGNDGDINYRYIAGTLYATRNLDDYTLCISNHDISKEISEKTKATVKNILDNITYVDEVEDTFSTAHSYFDAVAFDCGWYIDNIDYLQWRPKEMMLSYEGKNNSITFWFNLEDKPEEESLDGYRATYSIPMEDGTYLIISTSEHDNDFPDIHNWAEVEAFLNGKN